MLAKNLPTLQQIKAEKEKRKKQGFNRYYPETGKYRRELYPQHLKFFELGATKPTRCFMAANRVGKTEGGGGYEVALHLTGLYPSWWKGHRFNRPNDWWCAGDTKETVRDIIQKKMIGSQAEIGTGIIPGDLIESVRYRPNGNGAADFVLVKHVSGGFSRLGFKSYDQGRESFQGTEKDGIWLDEEANQGVRSECALRLTTTNGLLIETFTPLRGLTPIVLHYIKDNDIHGDGGRWFEAEDSALVMAGWDDVPHIGETEKKRMLAECEPHLVDARTKGIPSIGSGAIYPISDDEILIQDFEIPDHWPRWYGMDVGWKWTAAVWFAWDRDSDVVYIYHTYKGGKAEPAIHYQAIKSPGDWMLGACDYAGTNQSDGERVIKMYQDLGLKVVPCKKGKEAGIYGVWSRLSEGRLKVFKSQRAWFEEKNLYRRDEKGKIVKENDHLMDATQYGITDMVNLAKTKQIKKVNYNIPAMGW